MLIALPASIDTGISETTIRDFDDGYRAQGLNRGRFGTRACAAEEQVAEMTSAFLCAHLGITGELRHAGYLSNWIELLKADDRAIFTAAAKAQQAADFLRAFSEPIGEE